MDNCQKLLIALGIVLIFALCYKIQQNNLTESFDLDTDLSGSEIPSCSINEANYSSEPMGVSSEDLKGNSDLSGNTVPSSCYPKGNLNPSDLLPKNQANDWSAANPIGQGSLEEQNFLDAGFHSGINTVGNSLRNANMQLRSEPPNPQKKVSPWQQSTIEPDFNRKQLDIGE